MFSQWLWLRGGSLSESHSASSATEDGCARFHGHLKQELKLGQERWKTVRDELNRFRGKVWRTVTSKWRLHLTPFSQFWYGWGAGHIFSPVKSFWNRLHEVSLSFPLVLLCTVCWSHSEVHCSLPHRLCVKESQVVMAPSKNLWQNSAFGKQVLLQVFTHLSDKRREGF